MSSSSEADTRTAPVTDWAFVKSVETRAGWTLDTLHEHFDRCLAGLEAIQAERFKSVEQRFIDSEKALDAALVTAKESLTMALGSIKEAVFKSEEAYNERFRGINEFRGQLSDQAATFMPRSETEQRLGGINARIEQADKTIADRMTVYHEATDNRLAKLEKFQSELTGRMTQGESSKGQANWIIGVIISVVLALAAILVSLLKH